MSKERLLAEARELARYILTNFAAKYVHPTGFSRPPQQVIDEQVNGSVRAVEAFALSQLRAAKESGHLLNVIGGKLRMNLADAANLFPNHFNAEAVQQLLAEWDEAVRQFAEKWGDLL